MKPYLVTPDNLTATIQRVRSLALADALVLAAVAEYYPLDDDVVPAALTHIYLGTTRRATAPAAE